MLKPYNLDKDTALYIEILKRRYAAHVGEEC
jgi:hypothetical protein